VKEQNLSNHTRFDPWFHFFALPILLLNIFVCGAHLWRQPFHFNEWLVILSVGLLILAFKVRGYAVKVQDRVITLEERLRLAAILPDSLKSRAVALTPDQLIGLRFASDGELPALVEKTLNEKLARKDIKQAVQNWRADNRRV
jgi:Family of unknown function (DUF6526)